MVVTEWQLELDAHLEPRLDAGAPRPERSGSGRMFEGPGDTPKWVAAVTQREEPHVALEIDPADEGVNQP